MTIQARATNRRVNIIQQVADEAVKRGIVLDKSKAAIEWAKNFIRKNVYKVKVFEDLDRKRLKLRPSIGKMYMYGYDAKLKKELPYWDAFPCTIFFSESDTLVTGISIHYLPIELRVVLLSKLYDIVQDPVLNDKTRMLKSYAFLKAMSGNELIKPCIHSYLKSNFTTFLVEVPAQHWAIAAFLPTAQWQGAHRNTVYADSRRKITNG